MKTNNTINECFSEMLECFDRFLSAGMELSRKLRDAHQDGKDAASDLQKESEEITPVEPHQVVSMEPVGTKEFTLDFHESHAKCDNRRRRVILGTVVRTYYLAEKLGLPYKTIKFAAAQLGITPHYPEQYARAALYVTNEEAAAIKDYILQNLI